MTCVTKSRNFCGFLVAALPLIFLFSRVARALPAAPAPEVNLLEPPPAPPAPSPTPSAPPSATGVPTLPLPAASAPPPAAANARCTGFCGGIWTKLITIGPGLPALSIRFDGKLGFADRVAPLELGLNLLQFQYHPTPDNLPAGAHYFSFWRVSLGLTVTKDPNSSDVTFGGYVSPWGIQVDSFALGIGIAYSATGQVQSNNANFAIILPFSYAFQVGGS